MPNWAGSVSVMADIPPREALAATLTNAAEARGISTSELSRESHIARETLRRKLAGAQDLLVSELVTLADILEQDAADLINTYALAKAAA